MSNGTTNKQTSVLIIKTSLLVRCPDFRGPNVCMLIQMGPWTSILIILFAKYPGLRGLNVCTLNGAMDKCSDYQSVLIT